MNHLLVDHARAVDAERLRQAQTAQQHLTTHHHLTRNSRKNRSRPMPHTLRIAHVAMLAAVVFALALGGTAVAGKLITGKQVKNGSLTSADVKKLSGDDIAERGLTSQDFAELVTGPAGPEGPEGPDGEHGEQGPPGSSGLVYKIEPYDVPKDAAHTWSAFCPAGTTVLGGGLSAGQPSQFWLQASGPDISGNSWVVTAHNRHSAPLKAFAWAACAKTS